MKIKIAGLLLFSTAVILLVACAGPGEVRSVPKPIPAEARLVPTSTPEPPIPTPAFTTEIPIQLTSNDLLITNLGDDITSSNCWAFRVTNNYAYPIKFLLEFNAYDKDGIQHHALRSGLTVVGIDWPLLPRETWIEKRCWGRDWDWNEPKAPIIRMELKRAKGFLYTYTSGTPSFDDPFNLVGQGFQRLDNVPDELRKIIKFYNKPDIGIADTTSYQEFEALPKSGLTFGRLNEKSPNQIWEIGNTSESKTLKFRLCTVLRPLSPDYEIIPATIKDRACASRALKPKTAGDLKITRPSLRRAGEGKEYFQSLGLWVFEK